MHVGQAEDGNRDPSRKESRESVTMLVRAALGIKRTG
jgi:hypothetical protein